MWFQSDQCQLPNNSISLIQHNFFVDPSGLRSVNVVNRNRSQFAWLSLILNILTFNNSNGNSCTLYHFTVMKDIASKTLSTTIIWKTSYEISLSYSDNGTTARPGHVDSLERASDVGAEVRTWWERTTEQSGDTLTLAQQRQETVNNSRCMVWRPQKPNARVKLTNFTDPVV